MKSGYLLECVNRLTVSFGLLLQVEAGDVIVKINDADVVKYSIKEGKPLTIEKVRSVWGSDDFLKLFIHFSSLQIIVKAN